MMDKVQKLIKQRNEKTVFHCLGITLEKLDPDETIVSLTIDDRHRQHVGLVHGGIYVPMAESVASLAGACTLG